MRFVALPSETIINILGQAQPIDIRRCQLVCRRLRELVTSSSYLQYILELDSCGYTVPLISRSDLSYEEMIKMLREHREAWQDPSRRVTELIEISPRQRVNSYIADGVFTYGHLDIEDQLEHSQTIDEIHFHRLRSTNKGTGYEHWYHRDFGFPIEAYAIQPEIDLLVLVEGLVLKEESMVDEDRGVLRKAFRSYRLHFQTMSTNTPHYLPRSAYLETGLGGVSSEDEPIGTQLTISLHGRKVMLIGSINHSATERTVGVWDWVSGMEILCITIPMYPLPGYENYPCCHAYLLSEEYLVVYRVPSLPMNSQANKLGHFDIYLLCPDLDGPRRLTEFELPSLFDPGPEAGWHLTIASGPASLPRAPYWLRKLQSAPRTYETSPQDAMLCLFLTIIMDSKEVGSHFDHFLAHIPIHALLSHLKIRSCSLLSMIPWSDWGDQVGWVNLSSWTYPVTPRSCLFGQRHSIQGFSYYTPSGKDDLQPIHDMQAILDFNLQRIKFTQTIGNQSSNHGNYLFSSASDDASRKELVTRLNMSFDAYPVFAAPVNLAPLCRHMSLNVKALLQNDGILIDCLISDEHIIVPIRWKKDAVRRVAFHTYTF